MNPETLLDDPEPEPEIELEPDPEPAPEPPAAVALEEVELEPDPAPLPVALMQILPADFPLPALTRFVPDPRLKAALDQASAYALSVEVHGAEGLQRADLALTALRTSLKGYLAQFDEPRDIAYGCSGCLRSPR